jgi:glycosyltransferase involved in cell wall biosynthesis
MRVLMVNAYGRVTGGADKHCFDLACLLRSRGHEVAFLSTADRANEVRVGAFVPRHVSNATRESLTLAAQANVARRALWNQSAAAAARRLIAAWKPDVMHVHNIYPQLSVAPIVEAQRAGVPIVQTAHDYQYISATYTDPEAGAWDRVDSRLAYRLLNAGLYRAKRLAHVPSVDRWIAVSRSASAHYGRRGIQATVIPNFVPIGAAVAATVADEDRSGALYFGRLVPEKGLADVLQLAVRTGVYVRIAGSGPLEGRVREAAEQHRNIDFVGPQGHETIQRYIAEARVVVMPSKWDEPGPLAALEAMAAGTPVVSYPAGGLGEYVTDAGAGMVVEPGVEHLVAAVMEMTENGASWTRASHAGRAAAAGRHAPATYLDRVTEVYEAAIADPVDRGGRRPASARMARPWS